MMKSNTLGKSVYAKFKDYIPAAGAIIALGVISTLLIDGFMNVNNIGAILLRASVLATVAMGVTFVITAGDSGLDLSTGSLMIVGAMIGPANRRKRVPDFELPRGYGGGSRNRLHQWHGRVFSEDSCAGHDNGHERPGNRILYFADQVPTDSGPAGIAVCAE